MKSLSFLIAITLTLLVVNVEAEEPKVSTIGTAAQPIRCDRPAGEDWYLSRLRLPDGTQVGWWRLGSGGENDYDEHITDIFKTDEGHTLLMDMYHPRYVEILAPEGFRLLTEWSDSHEYVNGVIHDYPSGELTDGKIDITDKYGRNTQVEITKGWIVGKMRVYHGNGQLMRSCAYEINRPHGKDLWFYESGKPWAVYHFREGEVHGEFEFYNEEGVLDQTGRYEDGQLVTDNEE